MAKDPLHSKLCDTLGIEYPIIAFTHCKDVVAAVTNAGAFAVMGETHHTPDQIAADIKWIREKVGSRPFGIDLVFPASVPAMGTIEELQAQIPDEQRAFTEEFPQSALGIPFGPATFIVEGQDSVGDPQFSQGFATFIGAGITNPEYHFDVASLAPDAGVPDASPPDAP